MSADYAWASFISCLREGEVELGELGSCSGLGGLAAGLAERLEEMGLARISEGKLFVGEGGKLRIALAIAETGVDLRYLARGLDWRDFEAFAAAVMEGMGFSVRRNFRIPREAEIDVLGISSGFAVAVDCKHWGRYSRSSLREAALRQRRRVEMLFERSLDEELGFSEALPAVLTLYEVEGVGHDYACVVPIGSFRGFLASARGADECAGALVGRRAARQPL